MRHDHAVAFVKPRHAGANSDHGADKFMPEDCAFAGRVRLELEQIRTAKPDDPKTEQQLPGGGQGHWTVLQGGSSAAAAGDDEMRIRRISSRA
jgi:hypothetical protein